ncbi:hypothetical protein C8Q80DRAFT_375029 [Daedaleopsis nitida]|nr:hypothetical protein C8Q80DRAFT_375029 [Daedaleopsis nitida]
MQSPGSHSRTHFHSCAISQISRHFFKLQAMDSEPPKPSAPFEELVSPGLNAPVDLPLSSLLQPPIQPPISQQALAAVILSAISKLSRILDKLPLSETERSTAAAQVAQDPGVPPVLSQDAVAARKHIMLDVLFRFLDSEGLPPWTQVPRAVLALLLQYDGPRDEAFVQKCRELSALVHCIESASPVTHENNESIDPLGFSPTPLQEYAMDHLSSDNSQEGGARSVTSPDSPWHNLKKVRRALYDHDSSSKRLSQLTTSLNEAGSMTCRSMMTLIGSSLTKRPPSSGNISSGSSSQNTALPEGPTPSHVQLATRARTMVDVLSCLLDKDRNPSWTTLPDASLAHPLSLQNATINSPGTCEDECVVQLCQALDDLFDAIEHYRSSSGRHGLRTSCSVSPSDRDNVLQHEEVASPTRKIPATPHIPTSYSEIFDPRPRFNHGRPRDYSHLDPYYRLSLILESSPLLSAAQFADSALPILSLLPQTGNQETDNITRDIMYIMSLSLNSLSTELGSPQPSLESSSLSQDEWEAIPGPIRDTMDTLSRLLDGPQSEIGHTALSTLSRLPLFYNEWDDLICEAIHDVYLLLGSSPSRLSTSGSPSRTELAVQTPIPPAPSSDDLSTLIRDAVDESLRIQIPHPTTRPATARSASAMGSRLGSLRSSTALYSLVNVLLERHFLSAVRLSLLGSTNAPFEDSGDTSLIHPLILICQCLSGSLDSPYYSEQVMSLALMPVLRIVGVFVEACAESIMRSQDADGNLAGLRAAPYVSNFFQDLASLWLLEKHYRRHGTSESSWTAKWSPMPWSYQSMTEGLPPPSHAFDYHALPAITPRCGRQHWHSSHPHVREDFCLFPDIPWIGGSHNNHCRATSLSAYVWIRLHTARSPREHLGLWQSALTFGVLEAITGWTISEDLLLSALPNGRRIVTSQQVSKLITTWLYIGARPGAGSCRRSRAWRPGSEGCRRHYHTSSLSN